MTKLPLRLFFILCLTVLSGLSIFPWDKYGIELPSYIKPYNFGLDLNGGVELDYKVDLTAVRAQTGAQKLNENAVVESLKKIIDSRVINGLKLSEPTIQTAMYGREAHIIVQIPTQDYGDISEKERQERTRADITRSKEVIGKVVQLEFREEKKEITEEDKLARSALAKEALADISTLPFSVVGQKYQDSHENVYYVSATGALPPEAQFEGYTGVTLPYRTGVVKTLGNPTITAGADGNPIVVSNPGYAIVNLESKTGTGTNESYAYSLIWIDERPSTWIPAKTADGRVLNDKYLIRAGVSFTQAGNPQVDLLFNAEGKEIFAELTKRLIGKQIAIYVGGQMLTAPTVQSVIPDGRAVITGNYTIQSAQELANNINTGIVPAPIYLTSERTIDAKIGANALGEILLAGLIGLVGIIAFLVFFYHIGGLLAGIALVVYSILLVALVKLFGVVLTLASIAGIILSIGLAIDANILIFERIKELLRTGETTEKSIINGFKHSWTAIWDSHVTSLASAIILYAVGVSLIKGFGLMLGLGIVLSLFTAMWVSRVLIVATGRTSIGKNLNLFLGFRK